MKYHNSWDYRPYRPPFIEVGDVYINRLAPGENYVLLEWNAIEGGEYEVLFRVRGEERWQSAGKTDGTAFIIKNLPTDTDHEIKVVCGGKSSRIRLFRTGKTVGTVVNYLHPEDEAYGFSGHCLASPSIIRAPQGHLLVSMDVYDSSHPQNLSFIFRSDDNGKTWHYVCELFPCFWGKLFVHKNEIYMLSVSTEYGDLLIGKSTDGGTTWTDPVILLRGSNGKKGMAGVHRPPMPIVEFKSRLWTTLEWGAWGSHYHAPSVASAPVNSDLLSPESWSFAEPLMYSEEWKGVPKGPSTGTIEGSLVIKDGEMYNVMRYDMTKLERTWGLALCFKVNTDEPEAQLTFDRAIEFPANASKFTIIYDEVSKRYYTIANLISDDLAVKHGTGFGRNHLCLMYSENLDDWTVACSLIDRRNEDKQYVGFQYVDFFIEGEDILYQCRTAMNGARNFHDSNYATFHKIKDFRKF